MRLKIYGESEEVDIKRRSFATQRSLQHLVDRLVAKLEEIRFCRLKCPVDVKNYAQHVSAPATICADYTRRFKVSFTSYKIRNLGAHKQLLEECLINSFQVF